MNVSKTIGYILIVVGIIGAICGISMMTSLPDNPFAFLFGDWLYCCCSDPVRNRCNSCKKSETIGGCILQAVGVLGSFTVFPYSLI